MKHLKILTLFVIAIITLAASCKKTTDPSPNDFYFRCKINGQTYIPNSCANCITCTIYKDSIFLLGGNAGFEAIAIGIINKPEIIQKPYVLNSNIVNGGTYKNSTTTNDRFDTDSLRTGILNIETIDKINKIISGTFSFVAYNPVQNKTVNITEGIFRLKYTTN